MRHTETLSQWIQKIQSSKGSLHRNILFSFGQALISALCVFLAFRVVIAETSMSEFGVVTVMLAIGAATKIADVSGGSALNRLLPIELNNGCEKNATTLIHTVLTTAITLFVIVTGLLLLFADQLLSLLFENRNLDLAQSLLPLLALQIILNSLSGALISGIDGVHRADIRAILVSAGYITLLISSLIFIPSRGVSGYLIALILQHSLVTVVGWFLLGRFIKGLGLFPFRWDKASFNQTVGYAFRLNLMTLFAISFEPIAKVSIQIVSGPNAVGLYEVASRAVLQVRNLVVSASTPTIPKLASYKLGEEDQIVLTIKNLVPMYSWAAVVIAVVLATLAPFVSYFVFSELRWSFLEKMISLAIGWSMSVFVLPMYFLAQARGVLRWNMIGHVAAVAILGLGVAWVASNGLSLQVEEVVCAAVVFSSLVYLVGNYYQFSLYTLRNLFIRHTIRAVGAIVLVHSIYLTVMANIF